MAPAPRNTKAPSMSATPRPPHIVLIGPRGSGKTTIARALAARLGLSALDTDDLCLARLGATSVRAVWETQGEPTWRATEAAIVSDLLDPTVTDADARPDAAPFACRVIALGGGVPMVPAAFATLQSARAAGRAWICYLCAKPATLRARLRGQTSDRPAILPHSGDPPPATGKSQPNKGSDGAGERRSSASGDDPVLAEIERVLALRDPTYRALADLVLPVDGLDVEHVVGVLQQTTGRLTGSG